MGKHRHKFNSDPLVVERPATPSPSSDTALATASTNPGGSCRRPATHARSPTQHTSSTRTGFPRRLHSADLSRHEDRRRTDTQLVQSARLEWRQQARGRLDAIATLTASSRSPPCLHHGCRIANKPGAGAIQALASLAHTSGPARLGRAHSGDHMRCTRP
jgi:hypothetical protein